MNKWNSNKVEDVGDCGNPNCKEKEYPKPDPNCMCGKPLMIVIPAGKHIHPCPVHPDYTITGSAIWC